MKNLCKSKAERQIYLAAMVRCRQIYVKFVQIESRATNLFGGYGEMPPNLCKNCYCTMLCRVNYLYLCSNNNNVINIYLDCKYLIINCNYYVINTY